MSNFKSKYEDSENIKADRVNTVVFNLHKIKRRTFFMGRYFYSNERKDKDFHIELASYVDERLGV